MAYTQPSITITEHDYKRLSSLIATMSSDLSLLEEELTRANVIPDDKAPDNLVKMNSQVQFLDLTTGKVNEVTLVYPLEADVDRNRISVLAPMGSALIGLCAGQTIDWPLPNGSIRTVQVISVVNESAEPRAA